MALLILLVAGLSVGVRSYVAQVYRIESSSMSPTLHVGDRVLVEKISRRLRTPAYGEIVVFMPTTGPGRPVAVVKRVAGVPGDLVSVADGRLTRNGAAVAEPWALLAPDTPYPATVVPEGTLFLLGDNRAFSLDSRSSLGPVPIGQVVGRVRWRLHPDASVLRAAASVPPQAPAGTLHP